MRDIYVRLRACHACMHVHPHHVHVHLHVRMHVLILPLPLNGTSWIALSNAMTPRSLSTAYATVLFAWTFISLTERQRQQRSQAGSRQTVYQESSGHIRCLTSRIALRNHLRLVIK